MFYKFIKRLIDLTISILLLIFLTPLMISIAILISLKIGSPLFAQDRPGLNSKIFKLYKFKTMTSEKNGSGELLPDADRLNSVGIFLRSHSLDEIPQLFNVVLGDMSLVGPRPLLIEYLPLYSKEQARRHQVKPGITGWAQINGRNLLNWDEKFELDLWYVDNQSLRLDLKILFVTAMKVYRQEGISSQHSITMDKFTGSRSV